MNWLIQTQPNTVAVVLATLARYKPMALATMD